MIPPLPADDIRLLIALDEYQHRLGVPEQAWPTSTASGKHIWYAEPWRTEIDLEDILTSLARTRRYCGAIDVTVLQHTCICISLADTPRMKELMALHDMSEAYLGELPSPFKKMLPEYKVFEELWSNHIHRSLGVALPGVEESTLMKHIDETAALIELKTRGASAHHGDRLLTYRERETGNECLRYTVDLSVVVREVLG